MMRRIVQLAMLAGLAGCDSKAGQRPEPVAIAGTVTFLNGAAVRDVNLHLQPQDNGSPNTLRVGVDGSVKGEAIPGSYVFYFSPVEGKEVAFKAIPAKYHEPSADHTVEVKPDLAVRIDSR